MTKQVTSTVEDDFCRPKSSIAAIGLLLVAIVVILSLAKSLLIPITLSLIFALLLSPLMRVMEKAKIPSSAAAALLVLTFLGVGVTLISSLADPAKEWLQEAPRTIRQLQQDLASTPGNVGDNIQNVAEEVEELTDVENDNSGLPAREVVVKESGGVVTSMLGGLTTAFAVLTAVFFLTFFFLAYGNDLLSTLAHLGRNASERRRIIVTLHAVQTRLAQYLLTVSIINSCLGLLVAGFAWKLGIENPALWGTMVALFNFAPYAGAIASLAVLTLVSLSSFNTLSEAIILPLSFMILTAIEGQLITPSILGLRMSINPLLVFLAVMIWGWLWGIIGALVAVPLLICFVAFAEGIPGLRPVADFCHGGPEGNDG